MAVVRGSPCPYIGLVPVHHLVRERRGQEQDERGPHDPASLTPAKPVQHESPVRQP